MTEFTEFTGFETKLMALMVRQADVIASLQDIVKDLQDKFNVLASVEHMSKEHVLELIEHNTENNMMAEHEIARMIDTAIEIAQNDQPEVLSESEVERIASEAADEAMRTFDIDEHISEYLSNVKLSINID